MTMTEPLLSVIVPAHQAERALAMVLGALSASDFPRDRWELIVVDDASTDATAEIAAQWADRVVSLHDRPRGPGFARNRGVEASRGSWVVFIDADVAVHPDTLSGFAAAIESEPDLDAIFGAYDDAPPSPDFLSQYRNLLHRYVHVSSAGEAETFWAGCGAARRLAFVACQGFDEHRYPRPQIEDIELGYRLRDRGGRILLRPAIQGAHLKQWKFWGSAKTDLFDRGIPWVRLLLERDSLVQSANLNLKRGEGIKTALVGLALTLFAVGILWKRSAPALIASLLLLGVVLSNMPLFAWFVRRRGAFFALAVIPMNLWYYTLSGAAVVLGFGSHLFRRRSEMRREKTAKVALTTDRGPSQR